MKHVIRVGAVLAAVVAGWCLAAWLYGAAEAGPAEPSAEAPAARGVGGEAPVPTPESAAVPPAPVPEVEIPPIPPVGAKPTGPADRGAGHRPLVDERKHLFNREGRIDRDAEGRTVFVFDSGDSPMRLLENSLRQHLEDVSKYGQRVVRWRVSGQITEYRGANYLLLSKTVRIMPEEENL